MNWYVMVQGSYDCVFVGPFDNEGAAETWAAHQRSIKPQFEYYPYHEENMRANIAEFGECAIQAP